MKLKVNGEFLKRHLFAAVVLAAMGIWFGYDGIVTYPKTPAAKLYETIEKSVPPSGMTEEQLDAFKAQKIASQYGFSLALLLASAIVGVHLLAVSRLRFEFDDRGLTWRGRRYAYGDIKSVDRSKWAKKGILGLVFADGKVTLDAWHYLGVSEFEKRLQQPKNAL